MNFRVIFKFLRFYLSLYQQNSLFSRSGKFCALCPTNFIHPSLILWHFFLFDCQLFSMFVQVLVIHRIRVIVFRKLSSYFDIVRNILLYPETINAASQLTSREPLEQPKSKCLHTYAIHTPLLQRHQPTVSKTGNAMNLTGHAKRDNKTDGIYTIITQYILHAHAYHE